MTTARADGLEVGSLERTRLAEAVAVLARGMRDNPVHVAAWGPDPERRRRIIERLFSALFRVMTAQQPLCVLREGRVVAATGVAPAGTCQPTARQAAGMAPPLLAMGPRRAARTARWIRTWSKRDPEEPHVHLGPLAVDAHLQGQGIGSALLTEHCRRLDGAREVGYLETDKPENVRFYARQGFETVGEEPVLGVVTWYMRRSPAARGLAA